LCTLFSHSRSNLGGRCGGGGESQQAAHSQLTTHDTRNTKVCRAEIVRPLGHTMRLKGKRRRKRRRRRRRRKRRRRRRRRIRRRRRSKGKGGNTMRGLRKEEKETQNKKGNLQKQGNDEKRSTSKIPRRCTQKEWMAFPAVQSCARACTKGVKGVTKG